MRVLLTACVALGVAACQHASAQAPIREGLRRTGDVAVEGTRRVVEGTGQVIRGTGEVAADAAIRTGQAAGNIVGGTVNALTPGTPWQANSRAFNGDLGRNAQWRFARQNGEWWYYTPRGQWMYHRDGDWQNFAADQYQPLNQQNIADANANNQQLAENQNQQFSGEHTAGYRGDSNPNDQALMQQGQVDGQQVRFDRHGRPYICQNGRPLYLEEGHNAQMNQGQDQGQQAAPPAQPTPDEQAQSTSAPPNIASAPAPGVAEGESSAVVSGSADNQSSAGQQ